MLLDFLSGFSSKHSGTKSKRACWSDRSIFIKKSYWTWIEEGSEHRQDVFANFTEAQLNLSIITEPSVDGEFRLLYIYLSLLFEF